MAEKDYKAFIVEGEAREPLIVDNISKVFFSHANFKIIMLPAGENIYMLWKKLKEDDFETDIIEVLREKNEDIREQLNGITRDDFSMWKEIIDVFAMRISCLADCTDTITYDQYIETINPREIQRLEERENQKNKVFILSAFPEFLIDYFGEKLWKTCVKHTVNQLEKQGCKND